jgi:hypothetical protein
MSSGLTRLIRPLALMMLIKNLGRHNTDGDRPWKGLDLDYCNDQAVQKLFQASIDVLLGAGTLALFWTDRWNREHSPCVASPTLCAIVWPGVQRRRAVAIWMSENQ